MRLDGVDRDVELIGDLPIRKTHRDEPQHLDLAGSQRWEILDRGIRHSNRDQDTADLVEVPAARRHPLEYSERARRRAVVDKGAHVTARRQPIQGTCQSIFRGRLAPGFVERHAKLDGSPARVHHPAIANGLRH